MARVWVCTGPGQGLDLLTQGSVLAQISFLIHKINWNCVYICLTQLYGGRCMYIYYIKSTTFFGPIFIGHLQVDN